jgi:hypothetical protein
VRPVLFLGAGGPQRIVAAVALVIAVVALSWALLAGATT